MFINNETAMTALTPEGESYIGVISNFIVDFLEVLFI